MQINSMTKLALAGIFAACLFNINLAEAARPAAPRMCQGERFEPCICAQDVPNSVKYRPSEPACNGRAAVILSKEFLNSFSVVVRDSENRDRTNPDCELNSCSLFKVQKTIYRRNRRGKVERVGCLGAPGSSTAFRKVVRITIKVSDIPNSSGLKDIRRMCLLSPTRRLN